MFYERVLSFFFKKTKGFVDELSFNMGYIGLMFVGFIPVCFLSSITSTNHPVISPIIQKMVVILDYYEGSGCDNIKNNQPFTYVGENRISIEEGILSFNNKSPPFITTTCS